MDWRNWCRLCGNYETMLKIEPDIGEIIQQVFSIPAIFDLKICLECNTFLHEIHVFVNKKRSIDSMFVELLESEHKEQQLLPNEQGPSSDIPLSIAIEQPPQVTNEEDMIRIRYRFGLKTVEKDTDIINIFDESNINSALLIKLEDEAGDDEPKNEIISDDDDEEDDDDEDDSSNSDDDSDDQDSSNNMDTSHETSHVFHDDSSDSEMSEREKREKYEERKRKKKRKYQKSEEEKLFDFVCHICKEEFQKMCFLSSHTRKSHGCLPQVACYCGKALGTWKRLLIHKQKHFPEKFDYECKECKMVYKLRASFENHMRSKHGPDAKKFVCSQCARCFKNSRTLMSHEKTHLPDELKLTYPCHICQKKFVNKNSLKSHIISVHEMANLFTCESCGKGFSTKSNLKSHLYSHSSEKNVQCDICSARFKNMDSLRKHKKCHQEKSFSCKVCGNFYRNRNNLKAHMVCHTDEKQYKCTYCPNEYKRSKDLKCHLNLHTGERPYSCQFCDRTFVNGSNCRKHKLKDHPEELAAFEQIHGKGKAGLLSTGFQG